MADTSCVADSSLSPRSVSASAFSELVEHMKSCVAVDGRPIVQADERLEELLVAYRRRFQEQVLHDFDYNIQELRRWAEEAYPTTAVLDDARIQDGFVQLDTARRFFVDHDQWSNRMEIPCWLAFQQFYCDALSLGDRLLRFQKGQRPRATPAGRLKRRVLMEGALAYSFAQAAANALDKNMPNIFGIRPFYGPLPVGLYLGLRTALPPLRFRWRTLLDRAYYLLSSGALATMAERSGPVVEIHGREEVFDNDEFVDPRTHKTRHNLIIVMSHRHSTVDLPIYATAFRGIDNAMWANELYYPKSASRDPRMIMVNAARLRRLNASLQRSADLLMHERIPVAIVADGGGPYSPYGQQMCVKRGIRQIVDYTKEAAAGSKRKTFLVPMSFDDPATFLMGLDARIRITFHTPICLTDIAAAPRKRRRQAINHGDPLVNYLEAFFLCNTGQVRHGWRTPRVIETVRTVTQQLEGDRTLRGWLRKKCHASMFDLCRDRPDEQD
ncbi:MAG: hypothetical protein IID41_17970 [Planctomycetes bacterium]|nr:hypothetical protein [Planctomycetota bacterium]